MSRRSLAIRLIAGLSTVALLITVRVILEPRKGAASVIRVAPSERPAIKDVLSASTIARPTLLTELTGKRILLVGEQHFQQEPQTWLQELLGDLQAKDGRGAILLLELPERAQPYLDRYHSTGDESALNEAFRGRGILPYSSTVRWARAHSDAVAAILVDDENFWHVGLMRLLLTDTRNDTMAHSIAQAAQAHPSQRIVAYGGRLHMMNAGRYMYDSDTRRPIGARLAALGIPKTDIATIWLFAGENPIDGIWDKPSSLSLRGPAGDLPITKLEQEAIFGATRLKEIADYAVQLGPATPITN